MHAFIILKFTNGYRVGGIPTPLKILVNGKDDIPYIMQKNMFQTTNQIKIYGAWPVISCHFHRRQGTMGRSRSNYPFGWSKRRRWCPNRSSPSSEFSRWWDGHGAIEVSKLWLLHDGGYFMLLHSFRGFRVEISIYIYSYIYKFYISYISISVSYYSGVEIRGVAYETREQPNASKKSNLH